MPDGVHDHVQRVHYRSNPLTAATLGIGTALEKVSATLTIMSEWLTYGRTCLSPRRYLPPQDFAGSASLQVPHGVHDHAFDIHVCFHRPHTCQHGMPHTPQEIPAMLTNAFVGGPTGAAS